ncbi:MAG: HAD-IIIA family hydrolase, partial [Selenomonadaceae bacterium]|nr:HAD-IIIA family hydrolase [Selenomonadaceae bacterium]
GVARGYYEEADVVRLHQWMNEELARQGVAPIDGLYYCRHHSGAAVPEYAVDCDCRKPKPGMIFTACRELGIDAAQSFMVGDKPRDVECGEAAGAKGVLYEGGSLLACVKRAVEQR